MILLIYITVNIKTVLL